MITALHNGRIFTGREFITGNTLLIEEGRIKGIAKPETVAPEAKSVDCKGGVIAPGFIDLQIAGGGGYLFSDNPTPEALEAITGAIVKSGTTSFLIAMPTTSAEIYRKAIKAIREYNHPAILGLHLEGPFISRLRAGAHAKEHIRVPGVNEIKELLADAGGTVKMMTVAPEVCTNDVIKILKDYGVIVAAGHSNATFDEAVQGFRNGISTVTHLFNAMSPLNHRDPGLPGASYMTPGVCASIIADGIHVNYNMVAISKMIMKERLYLVSDAVEECSNGPYLHVRQPDRFTLPDGTLSGSALTMMQAVKNCINNVMIPVDEALKMASLYPAQVMNMIERGQITEGSKADITIFDSDFNITGVFLDGKQIL